MNPAETQEERNYRLMPVYTGEEYDRVNKKLILLKLLLAEVEPMRIKDRLWVKSGSAQEWLDAVEKVIHCE